MIQGKFSIAESTILNPLKCPTCTSFLDTRNWLGRKNACAIAIPPKYRIKWPQLPLSACRCAVFRHRLQIHKWKRGQPEFRIYIFRWNYVNSVLSLRFKIEQYITESKVFQSNWDKHQELNMFYFKYFQVFMASWKFRRSIKSVCTPDWTENLFLSHKNSGIQFTILWSF